jgi:hypothetical protein
LPRTDVPTESKNFVYGKNGIARKKEVRREATTDENRPSPRHREGEAPSEPASDVGAFSDCRSIPVPLPVFADEDRRTVGNRQRTAK